MHGTQDLVPIWLIQKTNSVLLVRMCVVLVLYVDEIYG